MIHLTTSTGDGLAISPSALAVFLSPALAAVMAVEIRNEAHGGVSPATLGSMKDSLELAPDDVVAEWAAAEGLAPDAQAALRTMLVLQTEGLMAQAIPDVTLESLLEASREAVP